MSELLKKLLIQGGYMEEAKSAEEGGAGGGGTVDGDDPEDKDNPEVVKTEKKPTDEEAKLLKEVMKQKAVLAKLKEQLAEKEGYVKELTELGGLDAVKALVAQKQEAETKKMEEKGEWDRLKTQMVDEHNKTLKTLQDQISLATSENAKLKGEISNLTVGSSFMTSKFIQDELIIPPSKARALYASHFDFVEGRAVAYDKPAGSAERTMLVDSQGEALDFESAIKKIVDMDADRDSLIKSKARPGAGSHTTTKSKTPADQLEKPVGISRITDALAKGALKK